MRRRLETLHRRAHSDSEQTCVLLLYDMLAQTQLSSLSAKCKLFLLLSVPRASVRLFTVNDTIESSAKTVS